VTHHYYGKPKKLTATKGMERSQISRDPDKHKLDGNSADSILRLRLLITNLLNELESLDQNSLLLSEGYLMENNTNFYEEVARFEVALIRTALQRTEGHQIKAAQLLKLNPSTLNAKIKQYEL
jgi:DNA-binding NtrC family response regulator